jgi:thiamine-monophosphate kinase
MPLGEFDLIERYFRKPAESLRLARGDAPVGIGDDAALLQPPSGQLLVAALDTLVEGRHFPLGSSAASIGHRALAVNLSDLAAMGAEPAWFLLALTLPAAQPEFLEGFAAGMLRLAAAHRVALVGGDTTSGPLSVSVQALGFVPPGKALRRAGGKAGDLLYVSGTPGDAAAGLQLELAQPQSSAVASTAQRRLRDRFLYPEPRVALGLALRGVASACIDVSDGLAADAGKLALASNCGVRIDLERIRFSAELLATHDTAAAARFALAGGDDYELCFTVSPARASEIDALAANVKCQVTCIGVLEDGRALRVLERGAAVPIDVDGYDHFAHR